MSLPLSPRIRPDFLLLHDEPTPLQCLEAFATAEGVEFCKPYANVLAKASLRYPKLPELIAAHVPSELIAHGVCMVLDGTEVDASEVSLPDNLLDV